LIRQTIPNIYYSRSERIFPDIKVSLAVIKINDKIVVGLIVMNVFYEDYSNEMKQ